MISIKDIQVLWSIMDVPFDDVIYDMLAWVDFNYPHDLVITSGHRPGDEGVHGCNPCRGVDIRSWVFDDPRGVVAELNEKYIYDPKRDIKVALYHKTKRGFFHIHLQSHPNTQLRDEFI